MPKSAIHDIPISDNLISLLQMALDQYGNQKEAAKALGLTDSTLGRLLIGVTRFPSGDTLKALAEYKSEIDGQDWSARQLMAWLWELPPEEMPPQPSEMARIRALLEDGLACLENGVSTLATVQRNLQDLGSFASFQDTDNMCNTPGSLADRFRAKLEAEGYKFPRDRKRLKEVTGWNDDRLNRLIAIFQNEAVAAKTDVPAIAATLNLLGEYVDIRSYLDHSCSHP